MGDGEEITYEAVTTTLNRAVTFFAALQASDGHWPAENARPLFFLPPLVMVMYITGHLNVVFPAKYRKEILCYMYCHQNEDSGWGFHIEGHSTIFCRALEHGTVTAIPSWRKPWLSILGVFEWSGSNPMPPEFWLLPSFLPIHPAKMWCYCRMVYIPIVKCILEHVSSRVLGRKQESRKNGALRAVVSPLHQHLTRKSHVLYCFTFVILMSFFVILSVAYEISS